MKLKWGEALLIGIIVGAGVLWLLATGVSWWVAYDRWDALPRLIMLTGGLALIAYLPWSANRGNRQSIEGVVTSCNLLAGAVGLFFLATHDWGVTFIQDFQLLPQVTAWVVMVRSHLLPSGWQSTFYLHENAVAGALIILLPMGVTTLGVHWQRRQHLLWLSGVSALTLGTVALFLTFSRGAWMGLGVGMAVTYLAGWSRGGPRAFPWAFVSGTLLMIAGVVVFSMKPGIITALSAWLPWNMLNTVEGSGTSRLTLWQDIVPLVQEYWFTGSGLQSTAMVLSSYIYLLHVPYLAHGHNLYLQLALEQGAPALLAFVMLTSGILWLSHRHLLCHEPTQAEPLARRIVIGATVALIALLVHGWFDAELYVSRLVLISFLPLALLATVVLHGNGRSDRSWNRSWLVGATLPAIAILCFAGALGFSNLYLINRATVAQTRAELSIYQWPAWPLQDAVRQHFPTELAAIATLYRTALQQNPANVTAHRRLGQILLSQGDYLTARHHLEIAYRLAPYQRTTRQLLGEAYALTGNKVEAHRLWQTVDLSQGQLALRVEWYFQTGRFSNVVQLTQAIRTTVDKP